MDFDPDRILKNPFAIGALGSLVALRASPGATWPERAFNIMSGALLSGFFGPMVAEYFGLSTPAMQSGTAFAVGLFGMHFVATTMVWLKDLKLADVVPWFKKG